MENNYETLEDLQEEFIWLCDYKYGYAYAEGIKKFIEDMAVWYEFRTPSNDLFFEMGKVLYEVDPSANLRLKLEKQVGEKQDKLHSDLGLIDNSDLFTVKSFLNVSGEDYLERAKYKKRYYKYKVSNQDRNVYLTSKGQVRANGDKISIKDKYGVMHTFVDINVEDLVQELCYSGEFDVQDVSELVNAIDEYKDDVEFKNDLLYAVMRKIIERGGSKYGASRGYLFAKEFKLKTEIPLIYGLDALEFDAQLALINDYLENGGNPDLECLIGYFNRYDRNRELDTITVAHELHDMDLCAPVEYDLYQRLVNALSSGIDENKLNEERKEEITRKRIERKLNKANTNR